MDGEGCVVAGPSGIRRQAYLRFPPPPPFPPDEYSYAYYAEGPASHHRHQHHPSSSSSSSHGGSSGGGGGSNGGGHTLGSRKGGSCGGGGRYSGGGGPGTSASLHHHGGVGPRNPRHSYITRYGTQENLYEEIGQMRFEEEVRYVHSKHLQVLDELNLSMEAMLMPDPTPSELTTEALMSPATCSVDSGFSSSSTGTNSLGRCAAAAGLLLVNGNGGGGGNGGTKKKSPHGFWRKLQGLGSSSSSLASQKQSATVERRWEESSSHEQSRRSSCSDVDLSSGDESNKCLDSKSRMGSKRCICRRNSPEPGGTGCGGDGGSMPTPQGRLARWFSIKKQGGGGSGGSSCGPSLDNEPRGKMPLLPEEDESSLTHRRGITPSLPPPPHNLNPNQIKLRHIVDAIVQSENSYLSTLWRLVYEYKKPLEESSPAILSSAKIQTLFHRVPEILQCHKLFNIALSDAVANWDREHRIGDVFVASFSKAVVLDIYSDFINNFSMAMDLARSEAKKKPALAEFFKTRQSKSHDRMSFFGLMVKPVQRFPQFILFLQDLLHNTGQGHPERMALQLALTQLESLAELLNERKREAEQAQAFRQMMRSVSAKMPAAAAQHKYLIRHDDVTQLEVNSCGVISKLKNRRLLLLNDQLICVSVSSKEENVNCLPRLTYKWSCSINDIQVIESSGSPTLSRLLTPNGSLASTNSSGTSDSLCMEMSQLMHDYQIISRIHDLTHSLKGQYVEVNAELTRSLLDGIQREIQRKDEQMAWLDSCCLEIVAKGKEEPYTFQMTSQETRKEWITELRLARLALDSNNTPAWEVPEQELRPSTKMPLFVAAHPVFTASPMSEVLCGCYYSTTCGKTAYLWVCTYDGADSHISIAQTWQTSLKPLTHFQIPDTKVATMEYVRNMDTVWLGTANDRIILYAVCDVEHPEQVNCVPVAGEVTAIKVHCDNVFASLSTGRLLMFRRHGVSSEPEEITLGTDPIACLLPINLSLYAACGKTITVMSAITGELQKSFTIHRDHVNGHISFLAHSGVGLWLSLSGSSTICLYHTETFKHLQDINVASNVIRVTGPPAPTSVTVTGLLAVKGLLWVGTNTGLALTIPLPRLEGVPIISGRVHVSYHGHTGSLSLLLPLHDPPTVLKRPPSKAIASDIYGLYGQLMYVKNYDDDEKSDSEWSQSSCHDSSSPTRSNDSVGASLNNNKKEHTLITITGGSGYVNYQHCCYNAINNVAHIVIWEMKL